MDNQRLEQQLNERRVAVLYVDEREMLDAFVTVVTGKSEYLHQLRIRFPKSLTWAKAEVLRVSHSWERRAFGFLVRHPSFGVVPDGGIPPVLDYKVEWEWRDKSVDEVTPTVVEG